MDLRMLKFKMTVLQLRPRHIEIEIVLTNKSGPPYLRNDLRAIRDFSPGRDNFKEVSHRLHLATHKALIAD